MCSNCSRPEQRAWRCPLACHSGLLAVLERQLQRDSGLSAADYTVLVQRGLVERAAYRWTAGVVTWS